MLIAVVEMDSGRLLWPGGEWMDFETAFELLIGHEAGYSDDPQDRGNWTSGVIGKGELKGTKYGIAAHVYPGEDIKNLTLERAHAIYRRDYWGPAGCDALPPAARFDVFDMAVNSGVKTAVKCLQKTVGTVQDGIVGPRTIQAATSMPGPRLIARFNGHRLEFMTDLNSWPTFGKGWARRIADNLQRA